MDLSVLILTRNEEAGLPDCFQSLSWCDDVVVLDSHSTDRTTDVALRAGARVFRRRFDDFAGQRNWAIDNIAFEHDWVFHLDADERFTPELLEECRRVIAEGRHSAYLVPSKMMLWGTWLRHGATYPVYQMRLMRLGEVRFVQHGHGQREGDAARGVGTLANPYLHHSFSKGFAEWFERHNRYSTQEALQCLAQQDGFRWRDLFSGGGVVRRRALKALSARLPLRPWLKFLYMYVARMGCLDGVAGLTYCSLQAVYEYMICAKLAELTRSGAGAAVIGSITPNATSSAEPVLPAGHRSDRAIAG